MTSTLHFPNTNSSTNTNSNPKRPSPPSSRSSYTSNSSPNSNHSTAALPLIPRRTHVRTYSNGSIGNGSRRNSMSGGGGGGNGNVGGNQGAVGTMTMTRSESSTSTTITVVPPTPPTSSAFTSTSSPSLPGPTFPPTSTTSATTSMSNPKTHFDIAVDSSSSSDSGSGNEESREKEVPTSGRGVEVGESDGEETETPTPKRTPTPTPNPTPSTESTNTSNTTPEKDNHHQHHNHGTASASVLSSPSPATTGIGRSAGKGLGLKLNFRERDRERTPFSEIEHGNGNGGRGDEVRGGAQEQGKVAFPTLPGTPASATFSTSHAGSTPGIHGHGHGHGHGHHHSAPGHGQFANAVEFRGANAPSSPSPSVAHSHSHSHSYSTPGTPTTPTSYIRKKSGELVKSSLKSRRSSSNTSTPGSLHVLTGLDITPTLQLPTNTNTNTNTGTDGLPSSLSTPSSLLDPTSSTSAFSSSASALSASEPPTPTATSSSTRSSRLSVHFPTQLEQVKHFLAAQKPLAVSRDGSPTADGDTSASGTEGEWPWAVFGGERGRRGAQREREREREREETRLVLTKVDIPIAPPASVDGTGPDVTMESLDLDPSTSTLHGLIRVRNLAFEKWVAVRFTMDGWQTTSEVSAKYQDSLVQGAYDRFGFTVRLGDVLAGLPVSSGTTGGTGAAGGGGGGGKAEKVVYLAVRYTVGGREIWDNNQGRNYQVRITRERVPRPVPTTVPTTSSTTTTAIASLDDASVPSIAAVTTLAQGQKKKERKRPGAGGGFSTGSSTEEIEDLKTKLEGVAKRGEGPTVTLTLPSVPSPSVPSFTTTVGGMLSSQHSYMGSRSPSRSRSPSPSSARNGYGTGTGAGSLGRAADSERPPSFKSEELSFSARYDFAESLRRPWRAPSPSNPGSPAVHSPSARTHSPAGMSRSYSTGSPSHLTGNFAAGLGSGGMLTPPIARVSSPLGQGQGHKNPGHSRTNTYPSATSPSLSPNPMSPVRTPSSTIPFPAIGHHKRPSLVERRTSPPPTMRTKGMRNFGSLGMGMGRHQHTQSLNGGPSQSFYEYRQGGGKVLGSPRDAVDDEDFRPSAYHDVRFGGEYEEGKGGEDVVRVEEPFSAGGQGRGSGRLHQRGGYFDLGFGSSGNYGSSAVKRTPPGSPPATSTNSNTTPPTPPGGYGRFNSFPPSNSDTASPGLSGGPRGSPARSPGPARGFAPGQWDAALKRSHSRQSQVLPLERDLTQTETNIDGASEDSTPSVTSPSSSTEEDSTEESERSVSPPVEDFFSFDPARSMESVATVVIGEMQDGPLDEGSVSEGSLTDGGSIKGDEGWERTPRQKERFYGGATENGGVGVGLGVTGLGVSGKRTAGLRDAQAVSEEGRDSPVNHLSDYSELLSRYCFYTGPDSSLSVPDPIQRSHSASSVEELLSSSSPRLGSHAPSGFGASLGWQSPSAMTGTPPSAMMGSPRTQTPSSTGTVTPRIAAVAMTGMPMVSSENDIAGMVAVAMMRSGSATPVGAVVAASSGGATGNGLSRVSPRTTPPFTPLVA